jgi:ribosome-binding protein aMBF1 (putative translation factor)
MSSTSTITLRSLPNNKEATVLGVGRGLSTTDHKPREVSVTQVRSRHATHCVKCGGANDGRGLTYWNLCSPCFLAEEDVKTEARRVFNEAKRKGLFPPAKTLKCVDCSKQAMDWDHRSYDRPLEVEPVCRSCNQKRGPATWSVATNCPVELDADPSVAAGLAIALRIRRAREALGWSKAKLARVYGTNRQTVQYWENGKHFPTVADFPRLCAALRVDANYLLAI